MRKHKVMKSFWIWIRSTKMKFQITINSRRRLLSSKQNFQNQSFLMIGPKRTTTTSRISASYKENRSTKQRMNWKSSVHSSTTNSMTWLKTTNNQFQALKMAIMHKPQSCKSKLINLEMKWNSKFQSLRMKRKTSIEHAHKRSRSLRSTAPSKTSKTWKSKSNSTIWAKQSTKGCQI